MLSKPRTFVIQTSDERDQSTAVPSSEHIFGMAVASIDHSSGKLRGNGGGARFLAVWCVRHARLLV